MSLRTNGGDLGHTGIAGHGIKNATWALGNDETLEETKRETFAMRKLHWIKGYFLGKGTSHATWPFKVVRSQAKATVLLT